jgi:hypothetical protein
MRNRFIDQFNYHRSKIFRLYLSKKIYTKYIPGNGLEVGALHQPLRVFNGAQVIYVDQDRG